MHSSRMRTSRSLTGGVCSRGAGGSAVGGAVSAPGGCLLWGVSAPGGSVPGGSDPGGVCLLGGGVSASGGMSAPRGVCAAGGLPQTCPPVNRMTNRCKNITLATTSLRPVTKSISVKMIEVPSKFTPVLM